MEPAHAPVNAMLKKLETLAWYLRRPRLYPQQLRDWQEKFVYGKRANNHLARRGRGLVRGARRRHREAIRGSPVAAPGGIPRCIADDFAEAGRRQAAVPGAGWAAPATWTCCTG